jgi:prepilin-type N-terminal cleavage/methylation domain-containing protein
MRARGFTLLEVTLASAIASVLVLTTFGLMRYIERMDGRLASRFDDIAELGRARQTIRRAMSSLAGVPDPPDDATPAPGLSSDLARERFGDESLADQMFGDEEEAKTFVIGFTVPKQRGDNAPKKIELRLLKSPVAGAASGPRVRYGAFELVSYRLEPYFYEQGQLSWALLWTPIDPPGKPTVLADALKFAGWQALDNDMEWQDEYEARYVGDFPRAIHVQLKSWAGADADWLFEPIVQARSGL